MTISAYIEADGGVSKARRRAPDLLTWTAENSQTFVFGSTLTLTDEDGVKRYFRLQHNEKISDRKSYPNGGFTNKVKAIIEVNAAGNVLPEARLMAAKFIDNAARIKKRTGLTISPKAVPSYIRLANLLHRQQAELKRATPVRQPAIPSKQSVQLEVVALMDKKFDCKSSEELASDLETISEEGADKRAALTWCIGVAEAREAQQASVQQDLQTWVSDLSDEDGTVAQALMRCSVEQGYSFEMLTFFLDWSQKNVELMALKESYAQQVLEPSSNCFVFERRSQHVSVAPWAFGVELYDLIHLDNPEPLSADEHVLIINQLVSKLCALHKKGYWLADLKPENLIFDRDKQELHIVDLAGAHIPELVGDTGPLRDFDSKAHTVDYLSQEVLDLGKFIPSAKEDAYALGRTLMRMCAQQFGLQRVVAEEGERRRSSYKVVATCDPAYAALYAVTQKLLTPCAADRPTVAELSAELHTACDALSRASSPALSTDSGRTSATFGRSCSSPTLWQPPKPVERTCSATHPLKMTLTRG